MFMLIKERSEPVNQYLRHKLSYKKYKLFDVAKFIFIFPMFRLIQQALSRTKW